MQAVTLEIILETVFGVHGGRRTDELRVTLREFLDLTSNPKALAPVLLLGPERITRLGPFRRRIERVDRLLREEIAERLRNGFDIEDTSEILDAILGPEE